MLHSGPFSHIPQHTTHHKHRTNIGGVGGVNRGRTQELLHRLEQTVKLTACCRKGRQSFLLLWPVLQAAACSRRPSSCEEPAGPLRSAPLRRATTWQQTETAGKRLLSFHNASTLPPLISLSLDLLCGTGPTSEPASVFLCSEVRVLLVPFARGQALFSV